MAGADQSECMGSYLLEDRKVTSQSFNSTFDSRLTSFTSSRNLRRQLGAEKSTKLMARNGTPRTFPLAQSVGGRALLEMRWGSLYLWAKANKSVSGHACRTETTIRNAQQYSIERNLQLKAFVFARAYDSIA